MRQGNTIGSCSERHPGTRYIELFALPGEQNEVAVRIAHDEGSRTPRLAPERLSKFDGCRLIFEKERLRVIERNRSGEQLLRVASDGVNHSIVGPHIVPATLLGGAAGEILAGCARAEG